MDETQNKIICPSCNADNPISRPTCWKCGVSMKPGAAKRISKSRTTAPSSKSSVQSAVTRILGMQIAGRPLPLAVLLGLYCIPLIIWDTACVLAMFTGAGGFIVGGIAATLYGGILYIAYQIWNGMAWGRTVFMILLVLQVLYSCFKLYTLYAGSNPFISIMVSIGTSPLREWYVLALCSALLVYLNTRQAKEYCG